MSQKNMSNMSTIPRKRKKRPVINYLLPIVLLGLMGNAISYVNVVFTTNTRWIILFVVFIFLMLRKNFIRVFDPLLVFMLYLYLTWCLLTSFWSEVPILSFMKVVTLWLIALVMIRAGIEWIISQHWDKTLDYIWLIAYVMLLSGFLGSAPMQNPNKITIASSGLISGSNMFGFMLFISFPYFLWRAYKEKISKIKQFFFCILSVICFCYLLTTLARSAILASLMILLGFITSLNLNKKISILLVTIMFGIAFITAFPEKLESMSRSYIYKSSYEQDVFNSRRMPWQHSYEAAQAGGVIGLGYGVSWGQTDFDLSHGLTANHYGREKGSSQLSIVEETGIIGLILYALLLSIIFMKIIILYFKAQVQEHRVLLGIIGGIFLGLFTISLFEAWWDSPGSPEGIYFWLLVGVVRGLEIVMVKRIVNVKFYPETFNRKLASSDLK